MTRAIGRAALWLTVAAVLAACGRKWGDLYVADGGGPTDAGPRQDVWIPPDAGRADPPDAIAGGPEEIVDLLALDEGYVVVLRRALVRLDRDGRESARWTAAHDVTAVALEGERVLVADRAALTVLDRTLSPIATAFVRDPCRALVGLGDGRAVCVGTVLDRAYVFDAVTARALVDFERPWGASAAVRSSGIAGELVAVASTRMQIFRFGADDLAPSGEWSSSLRIVGADERSFALVGSPASHVVGFDGRLLRIDGCRSTTASADCVEEDGRVDLASDGQETVVLDRAPDGSALAITGGRDWRRPLCTAGCRIVRVDPSGRTVTAEATWTWDVARIVALRTDPVTGEAILATAAYCTGDEGCGRWSVVRVALR